MSISHNLEIHTSLSAEEIKKLLLSSNLDLEFIEADTKYTNDCLYSFGISITTHQTGEYTKKLILEDYGFVPDFSIGFHILRYESETAGEIIAEKACAVLLAQGISDAVYFYNAEHLVFKRINGKLTIYEKWTEFLIPELNELSVTYELEKSEAVEMS